MNNQKIAYYGLFAGLALLMGYVELMIPMPLAVPGMKLGLANVIVLIVLYFMGAKSAFFLSILKILLSGLLFAGFAGFLYSLGGALLSFVIMVLCKRLGIFSIVGVSIAGGIAHNVGQIAVACAVVNNVKIAYYLPVLLVVGMFTGFITGIVAKYCLSYLNRMV